MTIETQLIKTQAELAQAITKCEELSSGLKAAETSAAADKQTIAQLTNEASRVSVELAEEKKARAKDNEDFNAAIAAKDSEVEQRANLKLHERATQLGIKPVAEEAGTSTKNGNAMKRKDFFQMSAQDQMHFMRSGGRIED